MKQNPLAALERAVEISGSQAELARRVAAYKSDDKIKQAHVWNWLNRDRELPAEMVLAVEAATIDEKTGRPRVLRYDLRPDLYPEDADVAAR
jgi:DNA-binding transcriptional regulator YdaS (Cro superfamily)